jgi:hypothetical protein
MPVGGSAGKYGLVGPIQGDTKGVPDTQGDVQ